MALAAGAVSNSGTAAAIPAFTAEETKGGFTIDADGVAVIDGSIMEGGGQILRNSTSLAALLGRKIKVIKIRAGRKVGGLKAQHLTGLTLVVNMHGGVARGLELKSTEFRFEPTACMPGSYEADIQTAGSVALLIQVALPCLVFAPTPMSVLLKGGTNVDMAPQCDYLEHVFKPIASRMGVSFDMAIKKRGFFPRGGGEVILSAQPAAGSLKPLTLLERGNIASVHVWTLYGGNMPQHVATTMTRTATQLLTRHLDPAIALTTNTEADATRGGSGLCCLITAKTTTGCVLAGSRIMERNERAEKAGELAAQMLLDNIADGGCVDEYLCDQLILFMALAEGKSQLRCGPLSLHTRTSMFFASQMCGVSFTVTPTPDHVAKRDKSFIIEVVGCGHRGPAAPAAAAAGTRPDADEKIDV